MKIEEIIDRLGEIPRATGEIERKEPDWMKSGKRERFGFNEFPIWLDPDELEEEARKERAYRYPPSDLKEEIEEINKEIEEEFPRFGTEVLAWYKPYHSSREWGIYIREKGMVFLIARLAGRIAVSSMSKLGAYAFSFLYAHESFHFLTEIATTFLEFEYRRACYLPHFYPSNFEANSLVGGLSPNELEEALANSCSSRTKAGRFLEDVLDNSPKGYRDYFLFRAPHNFSEGKRKLAQGMIYPSNYPWNFWEILFSFDPKDYRQQIPLYLIRDYRGIRGSLQQRIRVGKIAIDVYTSDHPPPHIHVLKKGQFIGKYLYPSLSPYRGAPPLSKKLLKGIREAISTLQFQKIVANRGWNRLN